MSVWHLWSNVCLFFPKPTHLADFNQVQTIQYSNSEDKDRKGTLQLKIAGAPEVRGIKEIASAHAVSIQSCPTVQP